MSFLFGKSKKHERAALPPATRNITSSDGPSSQGPTQNGLPGSRDGDKPRTHQQTPTPGTSVNNSSNSLGGMTDKPLNAPSQEQKTLRDWPDQEPHSKTSNTDLRQNARLPMAPSRPPPDASPYPWSQRRLNFTASHANPFPRYGAAVNSAASKDGGIYLMGGLINGSTVKGDLWMVEAGTGNMACYPVATTSEGPGPRVGHASLLVGNAFIVFGGDTKMDDGDMLDDTLYLLNTSTKQWSRALPAGPRPPGRYGHTLNILGSKIYIFGGQVEGYFFNDLVAFDLNQLQAASNRWELLVQNSNDGGPPHGQIPPARTNHSMVTWNDKLYLFGGTDGVIWFNDVWSYDPRTNSWAQMECIGYIPAAREGHAAALVNDVMYIFGGRTEEGNDLGDLAAFRISSRRWYTFQNMGPSPSPRSGHSMTAYGKQIIVVAGEPSSAPRDPGELSLAYFLDTSKIRYPNDQQLQQAPTAERVTPTGERAQANRRPSGERGATPQIRGVPRDEINPNMEGPRRIAREGGVENRTVSRQRSDSALTNGSSPGSSGSKMPRTVGVPAYTGPIPQGEALQMRANGYGPDARVTSPTMSERGHGLPLDTMRGAAYDDGSMSPAARDTFPTREYDNREEPSMHEYYPPETAQRTPTYQPSRIRSNSVKGTTEAVAAVPSRNGSRAERQQFSPDLGTGGTSRVSVDRTRSRDHDERTHADPEVERPVDSGLGSSPALTQINDELAKDLEAAKSENAWFASELALARKAGYNPSPSNSSLLDGRAADTLGDEDRPLIEALLLMRAELANVQGSIDKQAIAAASKIAEIGKQRDAAINEAVLAKAKLAAQCGSHGNALQSDGQRSLTPDVDRSMEMNRKLATSLATQTELSHKLDSLVQETEAERRARQLAEETADAAQKRVTELDMHRQQYASEIESLKAELHEVRKVAREEAANRAEAHASSQLLTVDKNDLLKKLSNALTDSKNHSSILLTLREAVTASSDKTSLLERKFDEEKSQRNVLERKLTQLRAEHEERTTELEAAIRRLHDAEELAEKHAEEARTHREAVLAGLGKTSDRDIDEHEAADERVTILQQQVEAATSMVRQNQTAADVASEKLRRAEERIAGLEAYQEQASREGLSIRKQLQSAMKEIQGLQTEKADLQQQLQSQQLETNAIAVQHGALKDLLSERGISSAEVRDVRRSRVLDSPSSLTRFGTPDPSRLRELEQQLEQSAKAHEEMRATFEQREHDVSKEWEQKLQALDNDHQAAVKYLRGTEKMLGKMKQELQR
ncbi:hypothetical protein LTR04_001371, partial [Oleoguttula sp. CCFEE 6159]